METIIEFIKGIGFFTGIELIMGGIAETVINWREDFGVMPLVLTGGGLIGLIFGIFAERSDFCSRMALVQLMDGTWRRNSSSLLTVLIAILTALTGVQLAIYAGLTGLDEAVSHETDLRVGGIILGSVLFGIGMVLARGCVSRLLVLSARGNSRAMISIIFLGLVAWSSISGVLAAPRLALASWGAMSFDANHSLAVSLVLGLGVILTLLILWPYRQNFKPVDVVAPIVIGLLVVVGFWVTAFMGADDFDPVPVEGLRFIQPLAETLSYWAYGSALPLKFGLAIVLGTITGAGLSSFLSKRSRIEGFEDAPHPLQYLFGAVLMGFGGVVSGGCTIGWMLNNASTGHIGVILAVIGYILGYKITQATGFSARQLQPSR